MNEFNNENQSQFKSLFFILKILTLFFISIPLIEYLIDENQSKDEVSAYLVAILLVLSAISFLWIIMDTKRNEYAFIAILEIIVFFIICTAAIYFSGAIYSNYKFIFILMIALYTIEYGLKVGITIALLASIILLSIDVMMFKTTGVKVNSYFENDIVLSSVFVIVAWILGFYVKIVEKRINELRDDINIDGLTGVYNHRFFYDTVKKLCDESVKKNVPLSMLMIDIDSFKSYNDMYGHLYGDEVLINITAFIKNRLRPTDLICRYGGDEFTVLMTGTNVSEAAAFAEKLRKQVSDSAFADEEHTPKGNITISIGVAEFIKDGKDNYKSFISRADGTLYRAKFLRRNSVEVYSSIFQELGDMEGNNRYVVEKINSLKTLITVINARDSYTFNHTERVVYLCKEFAEYIELESDVKRNLIYAAYLHDIGKINLRKEMLISDTKLSDTEWMEMRKHPVDSAEIISNIGGFGELVPIVLQHHERYDGSGYPSGLSGENIHNLARILTICDSYDAMTSIRPYQKQKTVSEATNEIIKCLGAQFDPKLGLKFIEMISANNNVFMSTPSKA